MRSKQFFQSSIIHPLLFAFFPILFVFSYNVSFLSFDQLFFPSLLFLALAATSWLILKIAFKNTHKSSIALSVSIILFFSYGHIQNLLLDYGLELFGNKILLPIFLLILILCVIALSRASSDFKNYTKIINSIVLTMIFLSLINLVNLDSYTTNISSENETIKLHPEYDAPTNVFYIILDSYAGYSALEKYYKFDNSEFLNEIEKREFNVIEDSKTNYGFTLLSLPSSLNMKYHDDFGKNEDFDNTRITYDMIPDNIVMKNFKTMGYDIIAISSGWGTTRDLEIADKTYCGTFSRIDDSQILISILDNSALKRVYAKLLADDRRTKILCQFDSIPKTIENNQNPVFVFAHMLIPHMPYIFGPNGELLDTKTLELSNADQDRNYDYIKQLQFTNTKVLELVDNILINSKTPPIIIIQSDHGPGPPDTANLEDKMNEQMHNLNMYYLPYGGESILYDGVSPVNSFRLIFNYYFNGEYEILEDKYYWSEPNPFQSDGYPEFIDVTNKLKL